MKTLRVLLVEDDGLSRELAHTRLSLLGYQVVPCANGREAIALVEAVEPFDLVITDLDMPVMRGEQLIRWLTQNSSTARTPVLVLSVDPDSGLQAGADQVLAKPYHLHELVMAIGEAVKARASRLLPDGPGKA
jgi:two-component system OmpR family response regulator